MTTMDVHNDIANNGSDDDDLDLPEGLFDESIFDSLNKEIEDLKQSFDLMDSKGSSKNANLYNDDYDDDDDDNDDSDTDTGHVGGGDNDDNKADNDNDDDDEDGDDDGSEYHDGYDEDPDSGETQLFSMMDDLVMQLQMDLKDDNGPTTAVPQQNDQPTIGSPPKSTAIQGGSIDHEQSSDDMPKPRSDSVGSTGSLDSTGGGFRVGSPEDREKGMRLHQQVRSLLQRVTDMTKISDQQQEGFQHEKKEDETKDAVEVGTNPTFQMRKRGDSNADQIERLLGAIESYKQVHTPSPARRKTSTGSYDEDHLPSNVSNDSFESSSQTSASPTTTPTKDNVKTARAMSSLVQRKRREYLLRKKNSKDEADTASSSTAVGHDRSEGGGDHLVSSPVRPVDLAPIESTTPSSSPTPLPVSSEEYQQVQRKVQEEKLRQHRQRQEALLRRRAQLLRQQQLLQQKEELLLQHRTMMEQQQTQQQQRQPAVPPPGQPHTRRGSTTNNNKKKKKGKQKRRTNKHRKGKAKATSTTASSRSSGYNARPSQHSHNRANPGQQTPVSRETLYALYAKLLALDEQLSAEYGDFAPR